MQQQIQQPGFREIGKSILRDSAILKPQSYIERMREFFAAYDCETGSKQSTSNSLSVLK